MCRKRRNAVSRSPSFKGLPQCIGIALFFPEFLYPRKRVAERQTGFLEMIRAYLVRHHEPKVRGYQYDVIVSGKLLATSHNPEFAAARALVAQGATGEVHFMRLFGGPDPDLIMRDVVRAAGYTVHEPDKGTVRFAKYVPFDKTSEGSFCISEIEAGRRAA